VLVTAGRHALAPLKEVRWEQLAGQESSCQGQHLGVRLQRPAPARLEPSSLYQMIHSESLYGVVRAGIAVGIMPSLYTTFLNDEDCTWRPAPAHLQAQDRLDAAQ
jgi:DNA-binding transcriptional LysR family regulator